MFSASSINGSHLPLKTLCLTYDDGPGDHTLAIAEFLQKENICATFFVVGKYAINKIDTLASLKQMGHIIGNHTYDHPDIPYYVSIAGDLQNQILRTDEIIKNYTNNPIYFRAPYGKWSVESANELNVNPLTAVNHIGPVHWDIAGIDCWIWQNDQPVEEALERYLDKIREVQRGIVVMHDDVADMDVVKYKSKTLELTKQLIPILKREGYRFIGLDEVLSTSSLDENKLSVELRTSKGKYLSIDKNDVLAGTKNDKSGFTITYLNDGKIALQNIKGLFVSANRNGEVLMSEKASDETRFDFVPINNNRFVLRTVTGFFLNVGKSGKIEAMAQYMRLAEIFIYQPLDVKADKPLTLKDKINLLKRRFAFVKRKVFKN